MYLPPPTPADSNTTRVGVGGAHGGSNGNNGKSNGVPSSSAALVFDKSELGALMIYPLDVPLYSAGLLSPFPTPSVNTSAASWLAAGGVHFNLHNNIWNTNFPQWYPFVEEDESALFRFELEFPVPM